MVANQIGSGHFLHIPEVMIMSDWVAIGSYLAVGVTALIFVVVVIKVRKLVYKDNDK